MKKKFETAATWPLKFEKVSNNINMASEDSNRSVADYFVVAGLPQKDPQLLDECSLEVNLKNGAYQDPITDIAVRV